MVNTALSEYLTKSDLVYAEIKDRIISGVYHPCERLIVADIARDLKVSPMPVREAFQRLQMEGFVENIPYVGTKVAKLDMESFKEIILVRTELESLAAKWAAPIMTNEQIDWLGQLTEEMDVCLRDGNAKGFSDLDFDFHRGIWSNCGNSCLQNVIRDLIDKSSFSRSTFVRYPGRMAQSAAEHKQIVGFLRARDAEGAFAAYRAHKSNSFQDVCSLLEQENGF